MTDTLWLKPKDGDGPLALIVDEQGRLILCDECPCMEPEDCGLSVDAKVDELLSEVVPGTQQPLWTLQGTHTPDYVCAVWEYDEDTHEWSLSSRASGHLLVALAVGATVGDTAGGGASLLTYAKTLVNTQTHLKRIVGCQCAVSGYECRHRMVVLDDMDIAGSLSVWEPAAGEAYEPADGCRVDSCELLKLKMATAQLWHGGTAMGEGYYDWLLNQQQWEPANYRYQPFQQAIRWTDSVSGDMLTYLDCDCAGIHTHSLATGETCLEYAGICTLEDPCVAMMLLHNKADVYGWTWHGEGVMAHKARASYYGNSPVYGDWYALRNQDWNSDGYTESIAYTPVICCAETSDGYWAIACGCGDPVQYPKTNDGVSGYWAFFDLPGACSCSMRAADGWTLDRELILTYPEEFGVDDVAWGNDNEYSWAYDVSGSYMGVEFTSHTEGCYACGHRYQPMTGIGLATMYIDYRALCFIGKSFLGIGDTWQFGRIGKWVRVVYPPGSRGAPVKTSSYTSWTLYFAPPWGEFYDNDMPGMYTSAAFTGGHYTPFSSNPEIYETDINGNVVSSGSNFHGFSYTWDYSGAMYTYVNHEPAWEGQYYTREEAEANAGCNNQDPEPMIQPNTYHELYWSCTPVNTPNFTVVAHPCQVEEYQQWPDDPTLYWHYKHKWWTMGAQVCENAWAFLNIHYVCTNKGVLVKGLQGFQATYTLPGLNRYPQYINPNWEQEYTSGYSMEDVTVDCGVDEDMHFCIADFEGMPGADNGDE